MNTTIKTLKELGINELASMKVKTFTDLTPEQALLVPKINSLYKFRYKELIEVLSWFNHSAIVYLWP